MDRILERLGLLSRATFAAAVVALVMIAFGAATAPADPLQAIFGEPIVGLWEITATGSGDTAGFIDNVFSGWTSDGLEFDQDTAAPILTGYVCYGTWIKLGAKTYGLTHPFFDYDPITGIWTG